MYLLIRCLLVALCLSFAAIGSAHASQAIKNKPVDKVLVLKSERKLHLMHRGEILKSYRVSLGKQPKGPKLREGDNRTPEGFYWIDWRKTSQNYNLSMHISYPNARDRATASAKGLAPGGMIMLHGTPVDEEYPEWYFHTLDWTNGCIAVSNADMVDIWLMTPDNTPIQILP